MNEKNCWLVTGGAGFIGSHLVERLLKEGQYVRVLDNFYSGKLENLSFALDPKTDNRKPITENFELITGDIRNFDTCLNACEGIDYVLHQAALPSVPRSVSDPITSNEINITGTLNMLFASKEEGIEREGQAFRALLFRPGSEGDAGTAS